MPSRCRCRCNGPAPGAAARRSSAPGSGGFRGLFRGPPGGAGGCWCNGPAPGAAPRISSARVSGFLRVFFGFPGMGAAPARRGLGAIRVHHSFGLCPGCTRLMQTPRGQGETSPMQRRPYESLRSARWFAPDDLRSFGHRSRMLQMGYGHADWMGKPVIAIVNTWSDANQCHAHFKHRVEDVKRGILQAGGFPLELPAISLSESLVKPTTMLYRNFLAMETEELLRSPPVDGAGLMGDGDKTTPGLTMGALSMDLPFIYLPAGPMLRGNWRGQVLGSGSDAFKYWDERQIRKLDEQAWFEMEAGIAGSHGTCMTMGTAATMMGIAEALGLSLPGASSIPAADANHIRMSADCGRRIVEMVWDDLTPAKMLTRANFENTIPSAIP